MPIEIDVWVRGNNHATTHTITNVPAEPRGWTDADVGRLLTEMLLALDREKNPGGVSPAVSLRGFNWIVSPDQAGGVLLHLEMQTGSASAGPFAIEEAALTAIVRRVMEAEPTATVH